MKPVSWFRAVVLALAGLGALAADTAPLRLHARARQPAAPDSKEFRVTERLLEWDPAKTAIIICDMWDKHWCQGATARVGEMAPRMDAVLRAARQRGVLILHAPSETMVFYADYPQRKRAGAAPKAPAPAELNKWRSLNAAKEPPLPIDDTDGGCDDQPQCPQGGPWRRETPALSLAAEDVVSDRGDEVYNVLEQGGITNVIIMGVHANMCVLGRPFSIRQMVSLGKNVVLMRDLTDTMYNSRRRPFVSHFVGTDLVVEHIEKYWCPSITSADFLGGDPFRFPADRRAHVVFLIGEREYDTRTTLPEFARQELAERGIRCTFVEAGERDPNNFAGLERIPDADLLFLSVRRRTPTLPQLEFVRRHLAAGKPLVGIRTASHSFDEKPSDAQHGAWSGFDVEILGAKYEGHYNNTGSAGPNTLVSPCSAAGAHPVLTGLPAQGFAAASHLYRSRNPVPTLTPLLEGRVEGRPETEPVAWVNTAANRRVFYTSLGSPNDFKLPPFRRLLLNGVLWALNQPIPPE